MKQTGIALLVTPALYAFAVARDEIIQSLP
jgi:hypothetical protein